MTIDAEHDHTLTHSAATLPALLDETSLHASTPFLLCPDQSLSYGQFAEQVDQFAAGLLSLGITRHDRIAIAAPNSAQWLITWFAAAKIGAVLVTLNVAYRDREFDYMLNQSGAVMLVCCTSDNNFDFVEFLQGLRPRIQAVRHFVFLSGEGFAGSHRWEDLVTAPDSQTLTALQAQVQPDDPAVILYTSGTTGRPKGATLTHASILSSATAQAGHLHQTANDVAIGHMPLNHVGGMTCTVTASMVAGSTVALLPRYNPQLALTTIERHKVTIYIGVPTMYTMMMDLEEFAGTDTSSVRTCIIGGSNVEPAMGRRILDTFPGARMANLYGLSETSGGCIISALGDDLETLVATLGVAIGDFQARIADDTGQPLPPDTEGELHIRGGCVAGGYWDNPADTQRTFHSDGWLDTGDMATQRSDGRIALCGRRKEMYVRSGYNVYPVEIENVLASDEAVAMSAVIGVPDALYGEVGHAYVVPTPGATVDVEALLNRCRQQLAKYKVPAHIHVVDSLPLTPSGKIKKVALREAAAT
ncbi:fatty-acyl-CoA synthase [Williamsia limnetica]|uniref:Fatty-acyl-CoA synthase n=1 Tax=Williamsia limnetica TaxID=882452 RepID=A0A318RTR9_WILLI|nr:AMP-binding protein [Williamsia limnetica]PYE15984.1 fatty-acyl-CoA synthase [Williamsia limnetica]